MQALEKEEEEEDSLSHLDVDERNSSLDFWRRREKTSRISPSSRQSKVDRRDFVFSLPPPPLWRCIHQSVSQRVHPSIDQCRTIPTSGQGMGEEIRQLFFFSNSALKVLCVSLWHELIFSATMVSPFLANPSSPPPLFCHLLLFPPPLHLFSPRAHWMDKKK